MTWEYQLDFALLVTKYQMTWYSQFLGTCTQLTLYPAYPKCLFYDIPDSFELVPIDFLNAVSKRHYLGLS